MGNDYETRRRGRPHRMDSNERVDRLDRDEVPVSIRIGMSAPIHGFEPVDDGPELGGQLVVGRVTARPVRVPADFRDSIVVEMGDAGWVDLVSELA
jgi:hypothetical protein